MSRVITVKGPIDPRLKDHEDFYMNYLIPRYNIRLPNGRIITSEDEFEKDIADEKI